jgi:hypothetical protein
MAIPVASVQSQEDAKALQVLCGVCSYDDARYLISPSSGFVKGNVDTLDKAGIWLESMYQKIKPRLG